jgi:hypothetical protein
MKVCFVFEVYSRQASDDRKEWVRFYQGSDEESKQKWLDHVRDLTQGAKMLI